MTPETVKLLLNLLGQVSIPVSAPDAEQQMAAALKARQELEDQLEDA
jgi:hypothetical protein